MLKKSQSPKMREQSKENDWLMSAICESLNPLKCGNSQQLKFKKTDTKNTCLNPLKCGNSQQLKEGKGYVEFIKVSIP